MRLRGVGIKKLDLGSMMITVAVFRNRNLISISKIILKEVDMLDISHQLNLKTVIFI